MSRTPIFLKEKLSTDLGITPRQYNKKDYIGMSLGFQVLKNHKNSSHPIRQFYSETILTSINTMQFTQDPDNPP